MSADASDCSVRTTAPGGAPADLASLDTVVFDALTVGVAVLDADGRVVAANAPWRRMISTGNADAATGRDFLELLGSVARLESDSETTLTVGLRAVRNGNRDSFSAILARSTAEGDRWLHLELRPLSGRRGVVAMHSDVTERIVAERRLVQLAQYDSLTGLPNRTLFRDRLNAALALGRRNAWQVAVLFIDLDRFKTINDTLGHVVGDRMLQVVGKRLLECMREYDTVSRFGGDEFAVVMTQLREPREAVQGAERIIERVAEPVDLDGESLAVTASVGITLFPADGDDADVLIRNADAAMYRAKELGSNGFQFFTGALNDRAQQTLRLEQDLRGAVARQEFVLYYQPQVSCATGRIVGFEALLRWRHPLRGLVGPVEFVPLLEETGLIVTVGEWVLRTACQQMRAWLDAGVGSIRVAVNVSGRQIKDGLCESVRDALDATGIDPTCLELELTESFLMRDVEDSLATLTQLKAMGVRLSVDDFGTGYSSLAYLKRFPVDVLKVDRGFVQDITAEPDDVSITRAIIALAHSLKLKVIAEGVETEGQLGMLAADQCDEFQGYLFSRPVPADEALAMLREGRCEASLVAEKPARRRTLLLVDDEPGVLSSLRRLLRHDGYTILSAESAEQGLEILGRQPVDVVMSDQRMTGMTGVDFLRRVKRMHPETVRLVLSGYTDLQSITEAINEGAIYKFLTKPWDDAVLRGSLEEAFRSKELGDENQRLAGELHIANQELARVNERLQHLLADKEQQLVRGVATLGVAQDILHVLPWPIIGVDDQNMVAFANGAAEALSNGSQPLLGALLHDVLSEGMVDGAVVEIKNTAYRCHRSSLGPGRELLLLVPREAGY